MDSWSGGDGTVGLLLLNKDVPVLSFRYDLRSHSVLDVLRLENPEYAPPAVVSLDGSISEKRLRYWWDHRALPASRDQLDSLISALGIESQAVLLERSFGLSLSDRYWVRPGGSELAWRDVNFFDNDFSGDLGALTLTPPSGRGAAREVEMMDPNSSVGGNVPKKWVIGSDGARWLVKAGNKSARQDVYNEIVASRLHSMALADGEFVPYELVSDGDAAYCACRNFLDEDEEYVPACDLLARHDGCPTFGTYSSVVGALADSGLAREYLTECLSKLFSLDYLMANSDRHTGNFGLIRDCSTLEYKRFAPVFDTGFSLWCDAYRLSEPVDYDYHPRPFTGRPSESPDRQLRLFDDYRWLPELDLERWREGALEILSADEYLPARRVEAIGRGISRNIEGFRRHVDRMAALFPANAPSWHAGPSTDGLIAALGDLEPAGGDADRAKPDVPAGSRRGFRDRS